MMPHTKATPTIKRPNVCLIVFMFSLFNMVCCRAFARTRTSYELSERMPAQQTPSEATTTRPRLKCTGARNCSRIEVNSGLETVW